jgi:hypothetical protein
MEINKPDHLRDAAYLGLNLAEAKQLLANFVAAQAKTHAVMRPDCPCGSSVRHVKVTGSTQSPALFSVGFTRSGGPCPVGPSASSVPIRFGSG